MSPLYRAIVVSDVHMKNDWTGFDSKAGSRFRTARFEDQLKLWDVIGRRAVRRDADAIFILGDLFDRPLVDPVTMAGTIEALRAIPVKKYFIPGNHDEYRLSQFQTEVFKSMGDPNFVVLEHAEEFKARSWLSFWPFHYLRGADAGLAIADVASYLFERPRPNHQNVALIHQSVKGCSHLGWVCDDGLDPDQLQLFDYTLAGHFHDHQYFIPGRGMYLSAPMHSHFGDAGRGAWYWQIDFNQNADWTPKNFDPGLPKYHLFDWDSAFEGRANPGDFLRIEIQRTAAEKEELLPLVEEVVKGFEETGVNVEVKWKPVYHHGKRLITSGEKIRTADDMIVPYVSHSSVATDGLDVERLASLGRSYLLRARG